MAFLIRKREERKTGIRRGLLEAQAMQKLQDRFCEANQVYLMCLSKGQGYLTKAYGSKAELEFLHSRIDLNKNVELLHKLSVSGRERVMEEACGEEYIKVCGIPIRVNKEVEAIWIMAGVLDWYSIGLPDCVMRTTAERYYKSLDLLIAITEQLFSAGREELLAQESFLKGKETLSRLKSALHRNEAMSGMIKMLDSQEPACDAAAAALREACEYLDVSQGALLKEGADGESVEVFCRYSDSAEKAPCRTYRKEEVPFFNGKTYMISADSLMPDEFSGLFRQSGWKAAMFLPAGDCGYGKMYLCFMEKKKKRIWNTEEIQFAHDAKRITECILRVRPAAGIAPLPE